MSRLVRITVDLDSSVVIVEHGEIRQLHLTREEKAELKNLREQLEPYGDFTSFKELSEEEIESITTMKKRRGELEQKEGRTEIDFIPVTNEISSIVMIVPCPQSTGGLVSTELERNPIYVENMPQEWIDKLFSQQLIIENLNIGGIPAVVQEAQKSEAQKEGYAPNPEFSKKHNRVREIMHKVNPEIFKVVATSEEIDFIFLKPTKWLGDLWKPLDDALKTAFGEGAAWISQGQGDKEAHWEVL